MSPRARTPLWIQTMVARNWLETFSGDARRTQVPSAAQVHKDVKTWIDRYRDELGEVGVPSLRRVQEIIADVRPKLDAVVRQRNSSPLSQDWPRDPDDVAYLLALQRIWRSQTPMTKEEILVALELKGALEWPSAFNEGGYAREAWDLADPRGSTSSQSGERAIISELTVLRELQGEKEVGDVDLPLPEGYRQINNILLERPWRSPNESTYSRPVISLQKRYWAPIIWSEDIANHENQQLAVRKLLETVAGFYREPNMLSSYGRMDQVIRAYRDVYWAVKDMDQPNHLLESIIKNDYQYNESKDDISLPIVLIDQLKYSLDCMYLADEIISHKFQLDASIDEGNTFWDYLKDKDFDPKFADLWAEPVLDGTILNCEVTEEYGEKLDQERNHEEFSRDWEECGCPRSRCPFVDPLYHPSFSCLTCGYRYYIRLRGKPNLNLLY